jgi:hypothetical protein
MRLLTKAEFDKLDGNGNGLLDRTELKRGLGISDDVVDRLMANFDKVALTREHACPAHSLSFL